MADAGIDLTKQIEEAGDISKEDLDRLGNLGVPGMLDVLDDVEVLLKQVGVSLLELEELENLKGTYDAEQGEHTRQPTEQTADLEVIEDGTKSPIEAESAEIAARRERVEAMKRKIRAKNEVFRQSLAVVLGEEGYESDSAPASPDLGARGSPPPAPQRSISEGEDVLGFLKSSKKGLSGALVWNKNKEAANKEKMEKEREDAQAQEGRKKRKKAVSLLGGPREDVDGPEDDSLGHISNSSKSPDHKRRGLSLLGNHQSVDRETIKQRLEKGRGRFKQMTTRKTKMERLWEAEMEAAMLAQEERKRNSIKRKQMMREEQARLQKQQEEEKGKERLVQQASLIAEANSIQNTTPSPPQPQQPTPIESPQEKKDENEKDKEKEKEGEEEEMDENEELLQRFLASKYGADALEDWNNPEEGQSRWIFGMIKPRRIQVIRATEREDYKGDETVLIRKLIEEMRSEVELQKRKSMMVDKAAVATTPSPSLSLLSQAEENNSGGDDVTPGPELEIEVDEETDEEIDEEEKAEQEAALEERKSLGMEDTPIEVFDVDLEEEDADETAVNTTLTGGEDESESGGLLPPRSPSVVKLKSFNLEQLVGLETFRRTWNLSQELTFAELMEAYTKAGGQGAPPHPIEGGGAEPRDSSATTTTTKQFAEEISVSPNETPVPDSIKEDEKESRKGDGGVSSLGEKEKEDEKAEARKEAKRDEKVAGVAGVVSPVEPPLSPKSKQKREKELKKEQAQKLKKEKSMEKARKKAEAKERKRNKREAKKTNSSRRSPPPTLATLDSPSKSTPPSPIKAAGPAVVSTQKEKLSTTPPDPSASPTTEVKPSEQEKKAEEKGIEEQETKKEEKGIEEQEKETKIEEKEKEREQQQEKKEEETVIEEEAKIKEEKDVLAPHLEEKEKEHEQEQDTPREIENKNEQEREKEIEKEKEKEKEAEREKEEPIPSQQPQQGPMANLERERDKALRARPDRGRADRDKLSQSQAPTQEREVTQFIERRRDDAKTFSESSSSFDEMSVTGALSSRSPSKGPVEFELPNNDKEGTVGPFSDPYVFDQSRGVIYYLKEGENTIGRSSSNAVAIPSINISRRHCCIKVNGTTVDIIDLFSTHGTQVNFKTVTKKTELRRGDIITLGTTQLLFNWRLCLMEGKLQKKSPAFHKKWQSRYCALKEKKENEVVLYYFKSQKDKKSPAGSLPMNSVISITEGDDNTFQMKTTERVWAFQAPNEEDRQKWVRTLCGAVKAQRQMQKEGGGTVSKRERAASVRPKVVNVGEKHSHSRKDSHSKSSSSRSNLTRSAAGSIGKQVTKEDDEEGDEEERKRISALLSDKKKYM